MNKLYNKCFKLVFYIEPISNAADYLNSYSNEII